MVGGFLEVMLRFFSFCFYYFWIRIFWRKRIGRCGFLFRRGIGEFRVFFRFSDVFCELFVLVF